MEDKVKYCIFNNLKICDDCGECYLCDLDHTKICDNCGKCLEMDADSRAIEIDEILDDYNDSPDIELNSSNIDEDESEKSENEEWELIDDIKGLSEMMETPDEIKENFEEEFIGFLKLKKSKK